MIWKFETLHLKLKRQSNNFYCLCKFIWQIISCYRELNPLNFVNKVFLLLKIYVWIKSWACTLTITIMLLLIFWKLEVDLYLIIKILLAIYKEPWRHLASWFEWSVVRACDCSNLIGLHWGYFNCYPNIREVTPH